MVWLDLLFWFISARARGGEHRDSWDFGGLGLLGSGRKASGVGGLGLEGFGGLAFRVCMDPC